MEQPQFNAQDYIEKIKFCIKNNIPIELGSLIRKSQSEQKEIVSRFQDQLLDAFNENILGIVWTEEEKIGMGRDSVDIFGKGNGFSVIIELDKPRADQVAKKMLSRIALSLDEPYIYVAVCYPGTEKMNSKECEKYFGFGRDITHKINPKSRLIGCIIKNDLEPNFY